jgi:tetratricopeptide (TPR) repeat protein
MPEALQQEASRRDAQMAPVTGACNIERFLHPHVEAYCLLLFSTAILRSLPSTTENMSNRITQLEAFLATSPEDAFLHHALALEYVKAGDEAAAERHFRHNFDRQPQYLATYYHLGKLLERSARNEEALSMYEQGMKVAKAGGDNHTYNELQAAYEDLAY